ncbi:MAG TPA: hypothetical protein VFA20_29090 [Myxococcaceae bacterium]|nr:hypothetical protein [Myxococcaceae bacterium]
MAVTTRRARGQATTEAALGILVISTVIVFGIHFSEVAMLSLKVEEANASALWDTTAKRMSNLLGATADFGPRTSAIQAAGGEASTRYADFDGRASRSGSVAPTLVFTQATPIQVVCNEDPAVAPMNLDVTQDVTQSFKPVFAQGVGGMVCWAESDFSLVPGFTRRFLQREPFRAQHVSVTSYHVCSMARANGGACPALAAIALGDWGLTTGVEAEDCDLVAPGPSATCANTGYYMMTRRVFQGMHQRPGVGNGQPPGEQLSQYLWNTPRGGPQIDLDEDAFFMAAIGETGNPKYQQPYVDHAGSGPYTVTPGGRYDDPALQVYPQAAQQRDPCAFGLPCDWTQWSAYYPP